MRELNQRHRNSLLHYTCGTSSWFHLVHNSAIKCPGYVYVLQLKVTKELITGYRGDPSQIAEGRQAEAGVLRADCMRGLLKRLGLRNTTDTGHWGHSYIRKRTLKRSLHVLFRLFQFIQLASSIGRKHSYPVYRWTFDNDSSFKLNGHVYWLCCFFRLFQDSSGSGHFKWSADFFPKKGGAPRGGTRGRCKSLQPNYGAEGPSPGLSRFFVCVCVCLCLCEVMHELFAQPWIMHRLVSF